MINSYAQIQISSDDNVDVEAPKDKELSDALSTVTTIGRNIKSKTDRIPSEVRKDME